MRFRVLVFCLLGPTTTSCFYSTPSHVGEHYESCYPGSFRENPYGELILRYHSGDDTGLAALRALIALDVPVDEPVANGSTPLMWAAWRGLDDLVQIFIEAGADVNAQTTDGVSVLVCAVSGHAAGVFWFANPVTLRLLEAGANVNVVDARGATMLMIVARDVEHHAFWFCVAESYGQTLAQLPVSALLELGADVNLQDVGGMTALMYAAGAAASELQTETVRAFLRAGADIHLTNGEGKTALMIAREKENQEIVRLLEDARSFAHE